MSQSPLTTQEDWNKNKTQRQNPLSIQNSRLSVGFSREQQVPQGCAHRHRAVGQWGTVRATPPQVYCHSQPGKRNVSSFFPSLRWINNAVTTPWEL